MPVFQPVFRFWDLKWVLKAHFRPNSFFKNSKSGQNKVVVTIFRFYIEK